MKIDKEGNFIQEDFTSSFSHNGTVFIVDYHSKDDWYIITERNFIVKRSGSDYDKVAEEVKKAWDKFKQKQ